MPPHTTHTPRRGWLATEGARRSWHLLRRDLAATPRGALRGWVRSIAVALALGAAWSVALTVVARWLERTGRLAWEADFIRGLEDGPLLFSTALWAESPGNSVFMIPVMLCAALLAVWLRRPVLALATLSSFFVLDLLVGAGWLAWNRARPDLVAGGIAAPGLHAFPSGHASQMVSAYGFFVYLWLRSTRSTTERVFGVALWACAVALVGWARMRLGAHWPSDIAAGVLVGGFWLAANVLALRRAEALGAR